MSSIITVPPSLPYLIIEIEKLEEELKKANQYERSGIKKGLDALNRVRDIVTKDK